MPSEKDKTAFLMPSPVAAKPSGDGNAMLLAIYPTGAGMGRRFPLTKQEQFLGRLEDLDIPLDGEGLSRRHSRIYRDTEGGWTIEDLGSTNGTHVNDVRIASKKLVDGDLIRCGVAICKFLSGNNIEAAYHDEIYRMTIIDGLTGVHNKRYFLEFLEREISSAARNKTPLSLAMVDIDHFKKINDTHGHLAGDAALKELCRRLKPRIRSTDLLARYGGEEFAVVLPQTALAGAIQLADELRTTIEAMAFGYENTQIPCTISLGVATVDVENVGAPLELVKRADECLYEAKRTGRNRVVGR